MPWPWRVRCLLHDARYEVATADADAALPLAHEIEEDHTGLAGLALVRSVTSRITTTPPCPASALWIGCPVASNRRRVPSGPGSVNVRLTLSPRAARACGVCASGSGCPSSS
jgi:hypothetical protein